MMRYINPFKNESGIQGIGEDRGRYLDSMCVGLSQLCRNISPDFRQYTTIYSYLLSKSTPTVSQGESVEERVDDMLSTLVCMGFRVMVYISQEPPASTNFNSLCIKLVRYQGNNTQGISITVPVDIPLQFI